MRPIVKQFLLIATVAPCAASCDNDASPPRPHELTNVSTDPGREKIAYYGCASCHTIPGIDGADGLVGPSLEHLANRAYIGGVLENTPGNLVRWIQNPPQVDPKTAMPNVRVSESDAREIAAYLYTLR